MIQESAFGYFETLQNQCKPDVFTGNVHEIVDVRENENLEKKEIRTLVLGRDVADLVRPWVLSSESYKLGMVVCTCNPSKAEAGGSEVQDQSRL